MKLKSTMLAVLVSLFLVACTEDTTYDEVQTTMETEIIDQNNAVEGDTSSDDPDMP